MSGEVRDCNADPLSQPKVFKFHNISKDRILGGKKIKKEVSKQKLHLKIRASCLEDSVEKDRTHIILQKYIPIKQKSVEMNANLDEPKTGHVDCTNIQSDKASISIVNDIDNSHSKRGGLRLKNISTLLQEPRKSIHIPDIVDVNHSHHQDAPLDLSKGGYRTVPLGGPRKPLDLSNKPRQDVKIAPKHQILTNSSTIQTNDIKGLNSQQSLLLSQNLTQPLKFVMVDKKCISKPLNPQSYEAQTCTKNKQDILLPLPSQNNFKTNNSVKEIPSSSKQILSTVPNQEPIQMLFLNGQLARVLPSLDSPKDLTKCNEVKDNKQNGKTKKIDVGGHKQSKESESMIKTNETVTKNGDLFCTFKNVKQIRLIREQQVRRGRQKKKLL